VRSGDDSME